MSSVSSTVSYKSNRNNTRYIPSYVDNLENTLEQSQRNLNFVSTSLDEHTRMIISPNLPKDRTIYYTPRNEIDRTSALNQQIHEFQETMDSKIRVCRLSVDTLAERVLTTERNSLIISEKSTQSSCSFERLNERVIQNEERVDHLLKSVKPLSRLDTFKQELEVMRNEMDKMFLDERQTNRSLERRINLLSSDTDSIAKSIRRELINDMESLISLQTAAARKENEIRLSEMELRISTLWTLCERKIDEASFKPSSLNSLIVGIVSDRLSDISAIVHTHQRDGSSEMEKMQIEIQTLNSSLIKQAQDNALMSDLIKKSEIEKNIIMSKLSESTDFQLNAMKMISDLNDQLVQIKDSINSHNSSKIVEEEDQHHHQEQDNNTIQPTSAQHSTSTVSQEDDMMMMTSQPVQEPALNDTIRSRLQDRLLKLRSSTSSSSFQQVVQKRSTKWEEEEEEEDNN